MGTDRSDVQTEKKEVILPTFNIGERSASVKGSTVEGSVSSLVFLQKIGKGQKFDKRSRRRPLKEVTDPLGPSVIPFLTDLGHGVVLLSYRCGTHLKHWFP